MFNHSICEGCGAIDSMEEIDHDLAYSEFAHPDDDDLSMYSYKCTECGHCE